MVSGDETETENNSRMKWTSLQQKYKKLGNQKSRFFSGTYVHKISNWVEEECAPIGLTILLVTIYMSLNILDDNQRQANGKPSHGGGQRVSSIREGTWGQKQRKTDIEIGHGKWMAVIIGPT